MSLFSSYEKVMLKLIDSFLPQRTVQSRQHPLSPWFNADCRALRRQAQRLERVYRRTRLPSDQAAWVQFVRKMHAAYRDREREYWEATIVSSQRIPRNFGPCLMVFLVVGPLIKTSSLHLLSRTALLRKLRQFALLKLLLLLQSFAHLSVLREITNLELRNLIMAAAPKMCELDPVPTFLVQELIDDLLPFLTVLCNQSIQEANLPTSQKRSILLPKLKRDRLDSTDPSNYRPIANVTFLSKILERIIANQLLVYLDVNGLFPPLQSGFWRNHSTETTGVDLS